MRGKYVSLTSFKHDGTAVATPVWFVEDGERLLVVTGAHSGKVKRIRRRPDVKIAPCSGSGRLHGEPVTARAELLPDDELPRIESLMARKYRLDRVLVMPLYRLAQRLRGKPVGNDPAALAITPAV